MSDIRNPHDRFVRDTVSQLNVARGLVQHYLPAEVVAILDVDRMELLPGSYIDPDLRELVTDLLFRIPLLTNGHAYLYLLMEHKSRPDRFTPFQILGYEVRIWEDMRRSGIEPAPILPLVLYHGRETWNIPTNFGDLFKGPEILRGYWPSFQYDLLDLSQYTDAEIHGAALERIVLLVLKHSRDDQVAERLVEIAELFREIVDAADALDLLKRVLFYVAYVNGALTVEDINKAITIAALPAGREQIMPTLVSEWIEKGRQEGIEQGIEQGVEQGIRDSILDLLDLRFPDDMAIHGEEITGRLVQISDPADLRNLHRQAALVQTLSDFRQGLPYTA